MVACALALAGPALAGTQSASDSSTTSYAGQRANARDHHPVHTSDGQPGLIAQAPSFLSAEPARANVSRRQVTPGVTYTRWNQQDARGPIRIHLLTVDPHRPGVRLDYATLGPVQQTARVVDILARDGAIAGVNGDFYDISDTGAPLGLGRDRQRGLLHGRSEGWNSAFYLTRKGRPEIGTLAVTARILQHPELEITNLNSPFVRPGGIGIYTGRWGRTSGYRVTDGQRKHVRIVHIQDGRVQVNKKKLHADRAIHGLVLIGRGDGARALRRLTVGSKATVRNRLQGRPQMAITGNKFLVDDGLVQVVDDREMQPRTAVGIDADTGEVLLVVVDGRQSFSRGYTMVEMARLMIDLGADEALNLDGGGSSTMVARHENGRIGVVNSPSDGFQRSVANALEVTYSRR